MLNTFLQFLGFYKRERGYLTVRYAFPLFVVSAIIASLASVVTQDTSYISITITPERVLEGEQFFVEVKVNAHIPINAVDLVIDYPEQKMTVTGIDTGTSVITLWTQEPYAKDGKVYLRGGVFKKGFLGEHTIARIRAEAIQSGIAQMTTENATLIAGDGKGTEVDIENTGSSETKMYITTADALIEGEATLSIITDLDGDGSVDLSDISAFMAAWFTRGQTFDFDNDGRMTFRDFSILLADSFNK